MLTARQLSRQSSLVMLEDPITHRVPRAVQDHQHGLRNRPLYFGPESGAMTLAEIAGGAWTAVASV
jgi:hypothetical protein